MTARAGQLGWEGQSGSEERDGILQDSRGHWGIVWLLSRPRRMDVTRNTSEAWGVVLDGSLYLTHVFSPVKWVTGPISRQDPGHRYAKTSGHLCSTRRV